MMIYVQYLQNSMHLVQPA